MKLIKFLRSNKELKQVATLKEAFGFGETEVISIVGGGGKTSFCYNISNELSRLGKKVILITTTGMKYPKDEYVFTGDSIDDLMKQLAGRESYLIVGKQEMSKLKPPCDEILKELPKLCDYLVIEADGSRRLPLKFPQDHEPVLHPDSTFVIGVCGIDALGKPIKDVCHRCPTAVEFLGKQQDELVSATDIAKALESEKGQMKNVKCRFQPVINKVDDDELLKSAIEIASNLTKNDCIISSFRV